MAATGQHIDHDKYPRKELQIACIGNDGKHLALMFSYLFEKPPYRKFKHPLTHQWLVVNENEPEHVRYKDLWEDADPMIPHRMLKGGWKKAIAWESEKERIPRLVRLTNGTVIKFYSAYARNIPKGIKFHLVWIDEEIDYADRWLEEMRARIIDFNGFILWSATPQNATQEFLDMQLASEHPDNNKKPYGEQTGFFLLQQQDNPYLSKEGSAGFKSKLSDEQLQIRYFGKSARSFRLAYPEFSTQRHVIQTVNHRYNDTRYLIFDPGVALAGVLFCMSPEQVEDPKEIEKLTEQERLYRCREGCIVIYDELYIPQANASLVAIKTKEKVDSIQARGIQDFTIDKKGSKTVVWRGMQVNENAGTIYMEALLKAGLIPHRPGWQYGSNEIQYGVERNKDYLCPQEDGIPKLFVTENCKYIIHEFKAHNKKRDSNGVFIGYEDKNNTLLSCLRYATTRGLEWVPPPAKNSPKPFDRKALRNTIRNLKSGAAFFPPGLE